MKGPTEGQEYVPHSISSNVFARRPVCLRKILFLGSSEHNVVFFLFLFLPLRLITKIKDGGNRSEASAPPLTADPRSGDHATEHRVDEAVNEDEETSSASDVESLSTESEGESDASDYLHVAVSDTKDFTVPEDRAHEAACELARHLRERPLLPPHPLDATQPWTDVASGVALPLWHCAFSRCGETFTDEE